LCLRFSYVVQELWKLEWLICLPWQKCSGSDYGAIDLEAARRILDEDHYGLDRIKKRILQHLAVMKLKKSGQGSILMIEASRMPGKGNLILTGQLGDVMKESAQIALSLLRARLPTPLLDQSDVHIHVPSGAIPKDGPSAGIALLTALASLFSGRAVKPRVAMTGEVTLRGAVLPVGGIKEKVIAAHRAGVRTVILSRKNERDLKSLDLPEEVRATLKFELVDEVSQVLKIALDLGFERTWQSWGPSLGVAPPVPPAAA
jgi:ATP-dependent Lon protease